MNGQVKKQVTLELAVEMLELMHWLIEEQLRSARRRHRRGAAGDGDGCASLNDVMDALSQRERCEELLRALAAEEAEAEAEAPERELPL